MSRIRTVKPDLFRHEALFDAELESQLPLRLAYINLFLVADCEGRFRWLPRTIKLDVLPFDQIDISAVLDALERHGFIHRYQVDGDDYGVIPTFKKHQRLQSKEIESGSTLPPPPGSPIQNGDATGTHPGAYPNATGTPPVRSGGESGTQPESQEGKGIGREGGRGEKEGKVSARAAPTPKTPCPPDLSIAEETRAWAAERGYAQLEDHLQAFTEKAVAKGYRYADWQAALKTAIREDWAKLRTASPATATARPDATGPLASLGPLSPSGERTRAALEQWLSQPEPEDANCGLH